MASSTKSIVHSKRRLRKFDGTLLYHIKIHENDSAIMKILDEDLFHAVDEFGSLLHYAALYENKVIARFLIGERIEIDCPGQGDKTPLMVAVKRDNPEVASFLLEANADIDRTNANGQSALQMVLKARYIRHEIVEAFLRRARGEFSNARDLAEKLIAAGSTLHHAVFLEDREVLEYMLSDGMDVDSKGCFGKTALHFAVESNRLDLAEWLMNQGADVNSRDNGGRGALCIAAKNGNKGMLLLLLERGADPNATAMQLFHGLSALCLAVLTPPQDGTERQYEECTEILLQRGADPQIKTAGRMKRGMFYWARSSQCANRMNIVIAHLAMLELLDTPITTVTRAEIESYEPYEVYYQSCRKVLKSKIFKSVTVLDLMRETDRKVEIYLRNREFRSKLERVSYKRELKIEYRYNFNTVEKRVSNILRRRALKCAAVSTLYRIINKRYAVYDVIVEKLASFLNQQDLERLCR